MVNSIIQNNPTIQQSNNPIIQQSKNPTIQQSNIPTIQASILHRFFLFLKQNNNPVSTETPLVSIIIPTYNRAHLIGETLDSVLAQTYQNWECIVVDDGSSDNTIEVLNAYRAKDARIKFYKRPADSLPGGNAARNYGYNKSSGNYIQWFDSDDIMHSEMLERQLRKFEDDTADFIVCQTIVFQEYLHNVLGSRCSELASETPTLDYIKEKIVWLTSTVLWKKAFLDQNKLSFDETLKAAQEWEFHIRCLVKANSFIVNKEPLVYIRQHPHAISSTNDKERIFQYFRARLKIYRNNDLDLSVEAQKYLRFYLFNRFKSFLKTKNFNAATYAYYNFLLNEKNAKIAIKISALFCILSLKTFNKGYTLIENLRLDE